MARTKSLLAFLVLFGLSATSFAAGNMNIMRGGLGFLFPDHNSFANPGQMASSHGMAIQGSYGRDTAAGSNQSLTPSFVYGNGALGFGAYVSRSGPTLTAGSDTAGVAAGAALLKGRVTVGAKWDKSISSSNNGTVTGTVTFSAPNRQGVSLGVAYGRALTGGLSSLTAGLGYSFMSNNNVELNVTMPDITSMSNFNLTAAFTTMKSVVYLGGGYVMAKAATTSHGVMGRLGFMLGQNVDLSGYATHFFTTGASVAYGGTLRASF